MNKELLIERIAALCKEKGVSMHTAFVESCVGKNFKSNLKTSDPSNKNLALLAKYFNVTVDYLLGVDYKKEISLREIPELGSEEDAPITITRIKALMSEKAVTWKQVSEELKIGKNQFKYWEENETLPDGKTLIKLSRYFNVSVDYLLGNEQRNATAALGSDLTEQEKTLLAVYRTSSEEGKLRIIQAVMNIRDESEKTHRVYRAARSSNNAEPVIVTRSQEDINKLRNAKTVTCDEDL